MTDSAQTLPVPGAVGKLYDQLTLNAMKDGTFNTNVHIGYWDSPDSDATIEEAMDRLTDVFIEHLKVDGTSHVLDLGCGVGGPGLRVVDRTGARVTGISISEEQIKTANRLAAEAGVADRAVFQHGDAMRLPFPDRSFDAVMALESLCHMPDRQRVLTEIGRVLVPGGRARPDRCVRPRPARTGAAPGRREVLPRPHGDHGGPGRLHRAAAPVRPASARRPRRHGADHPAHRPRTGEDGASRRASRGHGREQLRLLRGRVPPRRPGRCRHLRLPAGQRGTALIRGVGWPTPGHPTRPPHRERTHARKAGRT
ncbi:SAM-dependent methyltransferase [Streptomyces lasalocidi]